MLPLLLRARWRERFAWAAAFFIPAVVVSQSWKAYAHLRWGDAVILKPSLGLLALAFVLVPLLLPAPWRARVAVGLGVLVVIMLAVRGWPGQSPSAYVRAVKNKTNPKYPRKQHDRPIGGTPRVFRARAREARRRGAA